MWIRSQDKTELIDTKRIQVDKNKVYAFVELEDGYIQIGEYSNSVRAGEVMDTIEQRLIYGCSHDDMSGNRRIQKQFVFHMPES